LLRWA